jgi:uncharacterized YigZ family protein
MIVVMNMYSINEFKEFVTEIQKSKFICRLIKLNSFEQIEEELDKVRNDWSGATHYCYAYLFENKKKCSDDGEPGGTAGMPILNVLENNNLSNILCIVVRYFGGIKLGAGGLVRAYTQSVTNTLDVCELIEIKKGKKVEIIFPYNQDKRINYLLSNITILERYFEENIRYIFNISNDDLNILTDNNISYNILEDNIYI